MKLLFGIIGVVILFAVISNGDDGTDYGSNYSGGSGGGSGSTVIYVESTGSSTASITYTTPSGNIAQETEARLPWHKRFNTSDLPAGFNMNAQQDSGGSISCEIRVDGERVSANSSSGDYAIVSC